MATSCSVTMLLGTATVGLCEGPSNGDLGNAGGRPEWPAMGDSLAGCSDRPRTRNAVRKANPNREHRKKEHVPLGCRPVRPAR